MKIPGAMGRGGCWQCVLMAAQGSGHAMEMALVRAKLAGTLQQIVRPL